MIRTIEGKRYRLIRASAYYNQRLVNWVVEGINIGLDMVHSFNAKTGKYEVCLKLRD